MALTIPPLPPAGPRTSMPVILKVAGLCHDHTSTDDGQNWVFQEIDSEWQYTRSIAERRLRGSTVSGAPADVSNRLA